jgi:hypothetical protein
VPVVLARLPVAWVELAQGQPWAVRIVLGFGVLFIMSILRVLVYARLPRAAYLAGDRLVFPDRGRRRRVCVDDVLEVFVEVHARPSEQVFAVELRDGGRHELCPVDWPGAGRLYASLAKRLRKREAAAASAERKLVPGS